MNSRRYLQYLGFDTLKAKRRTREILKVPELITERKEAEQVHIMVYDYDAVSYTETTFNNVQETYIYKDNDRISWINLDGLRKDDIEKICEHFEIHPLLIEDILSVGQRPKMDEVEGVLFCLLYMLYYNDQAGTVETEQISIVLGKNFIISFQEDPTRDVFNPVRNKLKYAGSKVRQRGADYLCYSLLDMIVDNYYQVMDKLGDRIELLESEVIKHSTRRTLVRISQLRKELIAFKQNVVPVRDIISSIIRSENELIDDRNNKYFKDIYDHVMHTIDYLENYREILVNLQDIYLNNLNLKMNESMKVMAIVTCLLAPATVIGGIFGMNFDENVKFFHNPSGFWTAVSAMFLIPLVMIVIFKKRGWY